MQKSSTLPGFREFIQEPLASYDPRSFNRIKNMLLEERVTASSMFSHLLQRLTGRVYTNTEAKALWRQILSHKRGLEMKVDRPVNIVTAISDFFDISGLNGDFILGETPSQSSAASAAQNSEEEWITRALTPGFHLEKIKEEMMRVRRYKHALSAILFDLEGFDLLDEPQAGRLLVMVTKITRKTIRTVDTVARCCSGRFMVILPDTNKREARELAVRLRKNIRDRTGRTMVGDQAVGITASVGQYSQEETTAEFMRRLESTLELGVEQKKDAVYVS